VLQCGVRTSMSRSNSGRCAVHAATVLLAGRPRYHYGTFWLRWRGTLNIELCKGSSLKKESGQNEDGLYLRQRRSSSSISISSLTPLVLLLALLYQPDVVLAL
jgi:hypothetical protein